MKTPQVILITIFLLVLPSTLCAQESSKWADAITRVETLLQKYIEKSDEMLRATDEFYAQSTISPLAYAGNACANCYWPEHQCAILGRMLGKETLIEHLEPPLAPLSAPLSEVWSAAQSLDQWIFTAKRLVALSDEERSNVWNLECVGEFGIPPDAFDTAAVGTANFRVDGTFLWVYGDIIDGFYSDLISALEAYPNVRTVGLGSGGGSVREAVMAGAEIRRRGLTTQLTGPCLSACPLVFMGGVSRYVMRPFPTFGFHQVYSEDGALPLSHSIYGAIADYARFMGVDGDWIVTQMKRAGPEEMNYQGDEFEERTEICLRGLVTGYQGFGAGRC